MSKYRFHTRRHLGEGIFWLIVGLALGTLLLVTFLPTAGKSYESGDPRGPVSLSVVPGNHVNYYLIHPHSSYYTPRPSTGVATNLLGDSFESQNPDFTLPFRDFQVQPGESEKSFREEHLPE